MITWMKRHWRTTAALTAALVVGALIRGLLPPFVVDSELWRDFITGPPMGGIFALFGAGLAYMAARVSSRSAQRAALREEWWQRAQWALNLTSSASHTERMRGLAAIDVLLLEATATEIAMVTAVTKDFLPNQPRTRAVRVGTRVHTRPGAR